jgi:DNA-binding MarR family transcriptional regulator
VGQARPVRVRILEPKKVAGQAFWLGRVRQTPVANNYDGRVSPGSASTKPLTAKEQAAWRAFVRALAVAPRMLDTDLTNDSHLNMADYHVLVVLSESPEHSMRMSELASHAVLTPSGLTRVVERLGRRGLVERTRSAEDGRGQVARLTDAGLETLVSAYPPHLRSVRTRVMRHLRSLDLTAFAKAMEAIADEYI